MGLAAGGLVGVIVVPLRVRDHGHVLALAAVGCGDRPPDDFHRPGRNDPERVGSRRFVDELSQTADCLRRVLLGVDENVEIEATPHCGRVVSAARHLDVAVAAVAAARRGPDVVAVTVVAKLRGVSGFGENRHAHRGGEEIVAVVLVAVGADGDAARHGCGRGHRGYRCPKESSKNDRDLCRLHHDLSVGGGARSSQIPPQMETCGCKLRVQSPGHLRRTCAIEKE